MAALRGQELLDFVKENENIDRDVVIEKAGYVVSRGGRPSLLRTKFFEALGEANGYTLGPSLSRKESNGKQPTYRLRVGPKGTVPVGPAYTTQVPMAAGSYVKVLIDGDCIVLEPDDGTGDIA